MKPAAPEVVDLGLHAILEGLGASALETRLVL